MLWLYHIVYIIHVCVHCTISWPNSGVCVCSGCVRKVQTSVEVVLDYCYLAPKLKSSIQTLARYHTISVLLPFICTNDALLDGCMHFINICINDRVYYVCLFTYRIFRQPLKVNC